MILEPDPILRSLRNAVRARLRDARDDSGWSALSKVNALAMEAPAAVGGMGLGLAAGCAIAEELGRAALPARFLAVSMAIDAALPGTVDGLLAGDRAVCVAGFETLGGRLVLDEPSDVLAPLGNELVLLGQSDLEILPARDPSGAFALATPIGAGTKLCDWDPADGLAEAVVGRARLRQAAYLLGQASGALTCGVVHATRRKQFGQALRDFQGIGFRLADAYVAVEASRLAIAQAIWLADNGHAFGRQAAEVLAQVAETAGDVAHVSMQVCGVRGMTELSIRKHYIQIRREASRMGRPADLWRAAGRARLTETTRSAVDPSDALAVAT